MTREADVVIVGGGIAGTAGAWELAKRGASVIVCEKGEVGGEQSTRNWGFVRQQGRDPAEIPLMIESNRIWQGLERELNADLEWLQGGNLMTIDSEAEREGWQRWIEIAAGHGLDSRLLDADEVRALLPGSRFDGLGGVFTESDGQAEPTRVLPALRRAAEGRGVSFLTHTAVTAIETAGGAVSGVVTENGLVRAPVVVCAAGAWSGRLLRFLGLKLPQLWLKGSVARTTPGPVVSHAATWSGVAFRQRRDGSMNIATRSADHDLTIDSLLNGPAFRNSYFKHKRHISMHLNRLFFELFAGRWSRAAFTAEVRRHRILDPAPNAAQLDQVLAELRRFVPAFEEVEIERSWAGYIDMTPDMLPVIDRLDRPSGLVLATGFSGHGFGMGPITGRLIAELVLDGHTSLDLSAFRYARFHDGSRPEPYSLV